MILCPLLGAISTLGGNQNIKTFKLSSLKTNGCSSDLFGKLKYVAEKVDVVLKKAETNALLGGDCLADYSADHQCFSD